MNVLFWGPGVFPVSYSNQGYLVERLESSFRKFYGRYGDLVEQYGATLSLNVKWHSDPWPTVTSLPIRLSTNFMTFIPSLTFTELWVVSMEHMQRVWLASRERLPFRTPGSVPHLGLANVPIVETEIPRTCLVFTRLFTSNTPWYFLDFASYYRFLCPTWNVQGCLQIM